LTLLLAAALAFQIGSPGQYPPGQYPPGQYPPGRNPGSQGPGIPMPGRSKKKAAAEKKEEPTSSYSGRVRSAGEKSFELDAADTRTLIFQINDKTKKPEKFGAGDYVTVEAREDENGYYVAVTVTKSDPPAGEEPNPSTNVQTSAETAAAPESGVSVPRGPKYDVGDEGAPKLKRGKPVARAKASTEEATVSPEPAAAPATSASVAAPANAPTGARIAFIEQAKSAATGFLGSLPNFVCAQHTTRFVSDNHGKDWRAIDLLSVDVIYEGGREKYDHLTINGKPSKKAAEESGAWSTGEFGTILEDLFSPATAAKFRYSSSEKIAGFDSSVYKYGVERPHSHWRVVYRSQYIFPAYKGSLWLDKSSARVVRLEQQATDIPKEFLADTVESAVDYEMVTLGTQKYLLPVHAEVLTCQRGTSECDKNVIEFRNYHRFSGESNIIFK
jgi:hypothetical protein